MAALTDFAKLAVFVDGGYIQYITSCELAADAQNQRIDVLNEGLAGYSGGSGVVTINLGFVVPIGGLEVDYWGKCVRKEYVEFQVWVGGQKYAGKGKINTCNISQQVNSPTDGTMTWEGEFRPLEN